jgi:hypothetical protein
MKLGLFSCFITRPEKYNCVVALLLLFKTLTRVGYILSDTRPDRHCTASPLEGWAAELGLDRPEAWDNLCLYWKSINSPTVHKPATLLIELPQKEKSETYEL